MSISINDTYFGLLNEWFLKEVKNAFLGRNKEEIFTPRLQDLYKQMQSISGTYYGLYNTSEEKLQLIQHFQLLANTFHSNLGTYVDTTQTLFKIRKPPKVLDDIVIEGDPVVSSSRLIDSLIEKDHHRSESSRLLAEARERAKATTSTPPLKAPTHDSDIKKQEQLISAIPRASDDIEKVRDALREIYPEKSSEYSTMSSTDLIKQVLLNIHPDKVNETLKVRATEATKSILSLKSTLERESRPYVSSTATSSTPPSPTAPSAPRDTFKSETPSAPSRPYTTSYSDSRRTSTSSSGAPTSSQSEHWHGRKWDGLPSSCKNALAKIHSDAIRMARSGARFDPTRVRIQIPERGSVVYKTLVSEEFIKDSFGHSLGSAPRPRT